MMISWSERVRRRAIILSGDDAQSVALQNGFQQVTKEWSEFDSESNVPIVSGITAQGIPVEISLNEKVGDENNRLRFIAQPGRPGVALAKDRLFANRRAVEFTAKYGGVNPASFVAAALSFYPCNHRQDVAGNFYLWLGLEFCGLEVSFVKLYINPWASLPEYQGVILIDRLVQMAGFKSALPALKRLLDCSITPIIHIIGLNLDSAGITSLKVYFVLPYSSVPTLLAIADAYPGSEGFAVSLGRATTIFTQYRGQVHGVLTWRRGIKYPYFSASLFCSDWFKSDDEVLLASSAILDGRQTRIERTNNTSSPERWFTFLGIGDGCVTLYSRI